MSDFELDFHPDSDTFTLSLPDGSTRDLSSEDVHYLQEGASGCLSKWRHAGMSGKLDRLGKKAFQHPDVNYVVSYIYHDPEHGTQRPTIVCVAEGTIDGSKRLSEEAKKKEQILKDIDFKDTFGGPEFDSVDFKVSYEYPTLNLGTFYRHWGDTNPDLVGDFFRVPPLKSDKDIPEPWNAWIDSLDLKPGTFSEPTQMFDSLEYTKAGYEENDCCIDGDVAPDGYDKFPLYSGNLEVADISKEGSRRKFVDPGEVTKTELRLVSPNPWKERIDQWDENPFQESRVIPFYHPRFSSLLGLFRITESQFP